MSDAIARLGTEWAPRLLSALRIVAGLIIFLHGCQKLLGFPPPTGAMPSPFTLFWFAGVVELFGGGLILLGLFTRQAAFIASGEMAFAYFIAHAPRNLVPTLNGGNAVILWCFVFLYLVAAGPGPWSLDAILRKKT